MRFGEYLVAEGRLNDEQLSRALTEQRRRQIPLGLLAIHSGALEAPQVHRVLRTQTNRRVWRRFGEVAQDLSLLDRPRVEQLLRQQAKSRPRLGEVLVDQGVLGQSELPALLDGFHATSLHRPLSALA